MKHGIFKRSISFMLAVLMVFSSATVDVSASGLDEGNIVVDAGNEQASELVDEILSQIEDTEITEVPEREVTESVEMEEAEQSEEVTGVAEPEQSEEVTEEAKTEETELEEVVKQQWDVVLASDSCMQKIDASEVGKFNSDESNIDLSWEVVCNGANAIEIEFISLAMLRDEEDLVIIYNAQGEVVAELVENTLQARNIRVEGDRLTIRLLNEDGARDWDVDIYKAYGDFHSWDAGVVTKEVDGLCPGELTYTCAACGESRIEAIVPDGYEAAGVCGDNTTWLLDSEGVLTIQGTGEMYDSTSTQVWGSYSPWEECQEKIKKVVISKGVTNIGAYSFALCPKLAEIVIPEGVTTIGRNAFMDCKKLTSITLPSTLNAIKENAFLRCENIENVYVPSIDTWIGMERADTYADPMSYGANLYLNGQLSTQITEVVIKDGVKSIGAYAFKGWTAVTTIVIPDSCTSIGSYAFSGCTSLTDITIPLSSGCHFEAFKGGTGIKNVTVTKGIEGESHSTNGPWDTRSNINITIAEGVETISGEVFSNAKISNLYIPNSLKNLSGDVFYGASISNVYYPNLESILNMQISGSEYGNPLRVASNEYVNGTLLQEVVLLDGTEVIGDYTLAGAGIKKITIPSGVKTIGEGTFSACDGLSDIILPDSLEEIGSYAFSNCAGIEKIKIPEKVTRINTGTFSNCGDIEVELPNEITSIGERAFGDTLNAKIKISSIEIWCNISFSSKADNPLSDGVSLYVGEEKVTSLVLPDTVTTLKDYAFCNYTTLESVTIPSTLIEVGEDAFYGCTGLSRVYISDFAKWHDISFENRYANPMACAKELYCDEVLVTDLIIPEGTTVIGAYEYQNYDYVKNIMIPDTVTEIGDYAFAGCSGITKIEMPESVITIGDHAFADCTGITSIEIPESVTTIGAYAFSGCTGVTSIEISESVISIGDHAFADCTGITSIEIPESVTTIGAYAFSGCTGVISIEISESVISIGDHAFADCTGITSVEIPESVTTIGAYAFAGCTGITSIEISQTVTTIGDYAFSGCESLKEVTMPYSAGTGTDAFSNCAYVEKVILTKGDGMERTVNSVPWKNQVDVVEMEVIVEEGITSIRDDMFRSAENLVRVKLPESIATIGKYAFAYCSELESLNLPDAVTTIKSDAFYRASIKELNVTNMFNWCDVEFGTVDANPLSYTTTLKVNGEILEEYVIPDGVDTIKVNTFPSGTCLKSVTIPHSVTSIENSAISKKLTLKVYEESYAETYAKEKGYTYESLHNNRIIESVESTCFVKGYDRCICSTCGAETVVERVLEHKLSPLYELSNGEEVYGCIFNCGMTKEELENEPIATGTCGTNLTWKLYEDKVLVIEGTGPMTVYDVSDPAPWSEYEFGYCVIKEGVTTIGSSAFDSCTSLEYIYMPESLIKVESYAFYGCTALKEVVFKEALTTIEESAFEKCSALEKVSIYENATTVASSAFKKCDALTIYGYKGSYIDTYAAEEGIPFEIIGYYGVCGDNIEWYLIDGTLSLVGSGAMYTYNAGAPWADLNIVRIEMDEEINVIGNFAFAGLTMLTSVQFSPILSKIGYGAFRDCTGLANIEFPDTLYSYGDYAFEGCTGLQEITLPDIEFEMGESVFANCTGLQTVVIPGSPMEIGASIFEGCTSLENVTLEGYFTEITDMMFKNCKKLTTFTFPQGVKRIGFSALQGCNISDFTLPETLTSIETLAFALNPITSITLPDSVTTVASGAFTGCNNFERFVLNSTNTHLKVIDGVLYNAEGTTLLQCPTGKTGDYEMSRQTVTIADGAFLGCEKLTDIIMPSKLTTIGACAFSGTTLETYEIPGSVTDIDFTAFSACEQLKNIVFEEDNECYSSDGNSIYSIDKTRYYLYYGTDKEVTIPEGVEVIEADAYVRCEKGTVTYLPYSITSLEATTPYRGGTIIPYIYENCGYLRNGFKRLGVKYESRGYAEIDWSNSREHYSLAYDKLVQFLNANGGSVSYNYNAMMLYLTKVNEGVKFRHLRYSEDGMLQSELTFIIGENGLVLNRFDYHLRANLTFEFKGSLTIDPTRLQEANSYAYDWNINRYVGENSSPHPEDEATANGLANTHLYYMLNHMEKTFIASSQFFMSDFGFVQWSGATSVHTIAVVPKVEPTCTTDGKESYADCDLCHAVKWKAEVIPATGHTEMFDLPVEVTCTTDGLTEGKHCTVCEEVLVAQEVIPALGHTEIVEEEALAPTCTKEGRNKKSYCTNCEEILGDGEVIPALGHTKVVDIEAVEVTCTTDGLTEGSHCSVCEEILSVSKTVPALGHAYDDGTVVEPKCTTEGYTVYICANCQDEKRENMLPALGHTEEVLPGKEATETEPGMTGGTKCSVCEELLEEPKEIPALGFTIIYHLAGSKNVLENPERYFVDSERIVFAAPVSGKAGYAFAGWYLDEDYKNPIESIEAGSTGSIEVYARWIPYTYTVIFTDGSGQETWQSFTYGTEQALKKNSFKKSGSVFVGWSLTEGATEADFVNLEVVDDTILGVEVTNNDDVTKVLYAVWKDTYTVTYMGDDYELDPKTENYIEEYKYGKASKLPIPEKEGYVFGGWYKDESLKKKVASITNKMAEDLKLYAKWTPCSYTVKFNANAVAYTDTKPTGSMKSMAMKYDVTATLVANKFVLKGYEFIGWSLTEGKNAVVYTDLSAIENLVSEQKAIVTLYAQWKENPYTIIYNTNGGDMDKSSDEYWYGAADGTVLPIPERDGYDFAGWYKDEKFKKAVSKNSQKENILTKNDFGDMTLYAKWTGKKYDVVFDAGAEDATGKMNVQKGLVYGTAKALTKNGFKRTGYAFAGWSLEPVSQEAGLEPQQRVDFANGAKITGLDAYQSSITLYAVWDNQYTATFNAGEGTFADDSAVSMAEYTYLEGLVELPVPERAGYDFAGWYCDAKFKKAVKKDSKTGKYLATASDYGDMELFAKWTGKKYNVVFNADANDATGKTNTQKNLVYGTAKALTKNGFKRAGYVFIGWSLTPARNATGMTPEERVDYVNAEKVTGFGEYTSNVTLYAVWDNRFDVTIYSNGGTFENGETEQTLEYIYTKGVSLPIPERAGYDFAGWYYDAKLKKAAKINKNTQTYLTATTDSKDLELYAKWTGSKYNLTFNADADGVTGKTAIQKNRVYGTAKALTKNGFKRAGYKFLGWSLEPISQATTEELTNPMLRVDFKNAEKTATVGEFTKEANLYAVWEKESYKITYMNMGYFGNTEDLEDSGYVVSYTVDDKVVLKRPERLGYTFLGWYSDKNCKKRVYNIEVGSTGDKILYAKWKLNK
ncbi:MAG: leucine-rich repeat protein [Roseburia sp.]|nr:leucine-rich repeat protein [Roseburia sp.]